MVSDLSGDRWCLKQIYFVPSESIKDEFGQIKLVFFDKKEMKTLYFKTIDIDGKYVR